MTTWKPTSSTMCRLRLGKSFTANTQCEVFAAFLSFLNFFVAVVVEGTRLYARSVFGTEGLFDIKDITSMLLEEGKEQQPAMFMKDARVFMLRICMHVYCILNDRVLMQSPEPGKFCSEALSNKSVIFVLRGAVL
jgi:hypothetical protein